MLTPNRALMVGVPTQVGDAINATGTGQVRPFSILKSMAIDGQVKCQAIGTFTALDGNIEASLDGGTTWGVFTTFDFFNVPVLIFSASAGVLYRFNFVTVTQSVPPNILVVLS